MADAPIAEALYGAGMRPRRWRQAQVTEPGAVILEAAIASHPENRMPTVAQSRTCAYTSVAGPRGERCDTAGSAHVPLLMQRMLDRIAAARGTVETGDEPESERLSRAAAQIAGELRRRLDVCGGDPLAAHFDDQYEYLARRLTWNVGPEGGQVDEQVAGLDAAADLLREMRCAWLALSADGQFDRAHPTLR